MTVHPDAILRDPLKWMFRTQLTDEELAAAYLRCIRATLFDRALYNALVLERDRRSARRLHKQLQQGQPTMRHAISADHARSLALSEVVDEIERRLDEVRSDLRHGTTPFNHARRDTLESLLEWVRTHE